MSNQSLEFWKLVRLIDLWFCAPSQNDCWRWTNETKLLKYNRQTALLSILSKRDMQECLNCRAFFCHYCCHDYLSRNCCIGICLVGKYSLSGVLLPVTLQKTHPSSANGCSTSDEMAELLVMYKHRSAPLPAWQWNSSVCEPWDACLRLPTPVLCDNHINCFIITDKCMCTLYGHLSTLIKADNTHQRTSSPCSRKFFKLGSVCLKSGVESPCWYLNWGHKHKKRFSELNITESLPVRFHQPQWKTTTGETLH